MRRNLSLILDIGTTAESSTVYLVVEAVVLH